MNRQPYTMDKYYNLILTKIENLESLSKRNPLLLSQVRQLDKQFLLFMDVVVTKFKQSSQIIEKKTHIILEKELEIEILKEEITALTIPKVSQKEKRPEKNVVPKLFTPKEGKFFENAFGKNSPGSKFINMFLNNNG